MAGVLLTDDYNDFDMSKLIVKTPIPHEEYYKAVKNMYSIAFHPKFISRQLLFLLTFRKKDWQFLFTYGVRAVRRVRQHVFNLTQAVAQSDLHIVPRSFVTLTEHLPATLLLAAIFGGLSRTYLGLRYAGVWLAFRYRSSFRLLAVDLQTRSGNFDK